MIGELERDDDDRTDVSKFAVLKDEEVVLFAELDEAVDQRRVKVLDYVDVSLVLSK